MYLSCSPGRGRLLLESYLWKNFGRSIFKALTTNCDSFRYIPDVSRAIYDVLELMAGGQKTKRHKYGGEYQDMLEKVARQEVTEATLKQKLTQHVQQVCSYILLTLWFSVCRKSFASLSVLYKL